MLKTDFLENISAERGTEYKLVFMESAKNWTIYDRASGVFYDVPLGGIVRDTLNAVKFDGAGGSLRHDYEILYTVVGNLSAAKPEEKYNLLIEYRNRICSARSDFQKDNMTDFQLMMSGSAYYDSSVFVPAGSAVLPNKDGVQTYYKLFGCKTPDDAFIADLERLFFGNAEKIHACERCGHLFLSNAGNAKYCEECRKKVSTLNAERIRRNTPRYLHKRTLKKIVYYTPELAPDFLAESNYYYSCVKNKPAERPAFAKENIKTERQYMAWLQRKFDNAAK